MWKHMRMGTRQRVVKAQLLRAVQHRVVREYKQRLRKQDVIDGHSRFPCIRVLRGMTQPQQRVVQDILRGKHKTLCVKDTLNPSDWFATTLLIDVLSVAPVNIVYLQNLCLDDFQMNRLIDALQANMNLVAVNIGEVGNVSMDTWERLVEAIPVTNINFMYVSEHQATADITRQLKKRTKFNRDNTTSKVDWKLTGTALDVVKMWWNGTTSKRKGTIP